MTPTAVMFRGETKELPSEKDAYVWLIEKFLHIKPDLFTAPEAEKYVCKGSRGAVLFATSLRSMHQPKRLISGWYVEACLSNDQKVRALDNVAHYAGLKRGTDWEWQAAIRPTKEFIDADEGLRRL